MTRVADELVNHETEIMAANALDVAAAETRISAQLMNRLKLKHTKIVQVANGIRAIAAQEEPIG